MHAGTPSLEHRLILAWGHPAIVAWYHLRMLVWEHARMVPWRHKAWRKHWSWPYNVLGINTLNGRYWQFNMLRIFQY
jgi:hypothetical protein